MPKKSYINVKENFHHMQLSTPLILNEKLHMLLKIFTLVNKLFILLQLCSIGHDFLHNYKNYRQHLHHIQMYEE